MNRSFPPLRTPSMRLTIFGFTVLVLVAFVGCGRQPAKVAGKVTCNGNPVKGSILFSPAGEGEANTGEAVAAPLKDDGTFALELKTSGKHRVVVSPSDIKYPAPPGEEYPCDLTPVEKDLKPGTNDVTLELSPRKKQPRSSP